MGKCRRCVGIEIGMRSGKMVESNLENSFFFFIQRTKSHFIRFDNITDHNEYMNDLHK